MWNSLTNKIASGVNSSLLSFTEPFGTDLSDNESELPPPSATKNVTERRKNHPNSNERDYSDDLLASIDSGESKEPTSEQNVNSGHQNVNNSNHDQITTNESARSRSGFSESSDSESARSSGGFNEDNQIENNYKQVRPKMNSFLVTTKDDQEIMPYTPEKPEKWFPYFEEVTKNEAGDRKKLLTKVLAAEPDMKNVLLENYTKTYSELKEVIIEYAKAQKKAAAFYSVDYKFPKIRQSDVREKFMRIYKSYEERRDGLPLELVKANLHSTVRKYVLNHEANTIDRVIELAEQAMANRPEGEKALRCFTCNRVGHKAVECYSNKASRYKPYNSGRGGHQQQGGGRASQFRGNYSSNFNPNVQNNYQGTGNGNSRDKRVNVVEDQSKVRVFFRV